MKRRDSLNWRHSNGDKPYIWCESIFPNIWLASNFYEDQEEFPGSLMGSLFLLGPHNDDLLTCPKNWIVA